MVRENWQVEHLLRRAAFGPSRTDLARFAESPTSAVVEYLIEYQRQPDDVDTYIGRPEYVSVTTRGGAFAPNTNIEDARQRWLFRMVHSERPLQEKMALFWHNHFATAYSKVAGFAGGLQGTKMMSAQIDLFRRYALGNFRSLLIDVASDAAMIVWLDGRTNFRARPQENFAREIMELFTWGVGNYTEQDVYAAARVFTGWNLQRIPPNGSNNDPETDYQFLYNPGQHDTSAKTFTFPIYADGGRTIPARSAAEGIQDGIDFIAALARHPETARRLARKLWAFFVSEVHPADPAFVEAVTDEYLRNNTEMKPVLRYILRSPWFNDPDVWFTRYAWPVEFVVRAIREVGWTGFSVDAARTPLTNMGQTLLEPPDVAGWELGAGWFSTGAMLARMNFAATLAANQRFNLARALGSARTSPDQMLDYFLFERLSPAPFELGPYRELLAYVNTATPWTGSDAQVNAKAAGVTRLIVGSSEYQFV
ncbi:MAG: DUF1800 domain-containing protein [Acidobacteria bacterium]|nr:DUF1800 domain-containing protein [Acidobacteriota bacterium]